MASKYRGGMSHFSIRNLTVGNELLRNVHEGGVAPAVRFRGIANLANNANVYPTFLLPPEGPAVTPKLELASFVESAPVSDQNAVINVGYRVDTGVGYLQSKAFTAGGPFTITHTTANGVAQLVTTIALTGLSINYGADIAVQLDIELVAASWTLALNWFFEPYLLVTD